MRILINILVGSFAVLAAAGLLAGVSVDNAVTAVSVAVILGLANALFPPVLPVMPLPLKMAVLGLVTFILSGVLVMLIAEFLPGFHVAGFRWALVFAFVLSLINVCFHWYRRSGA